MNGKCRRCGPEDWVGDAGFPGLKNARFRFLKKAALTHLGKNPILAASRGKQCVGRASGQR
jgi:hypothetical protein